MSHFLKRSSMWHEKMDGVTNKNFQGTVLHCLKFSVVVHPKNNRYNSHTKYWKSSTLLRDYQRGTFRHLWSDLACRYFDSPR